MMYRNVANMSVEFELEIRHMQYLPFGGKLLDIRVNENVVSNARLEANVQ